MTRETRIVLALSGTPCIDSARQDASALVAEGIDWDRLFQLAAIFEVAPVFFSNLRSLPHGSIPPEILDRAAIAERDARAFALSRTLLLVDLYRKFEAAGIDVLVLKGPAIGVMGYDDPSMRTYGDIDLFTKRVHLPRARDLLLGLGYTRDYEAASETALIRGGHALELSGPGSKVELHTELVERHLGFHLGGQELWDEAVSVKCAGSDIRVLDKPRLLLFLCAHGTKHEWIRVRWICDIAQVADRLEAEEIARVVALSERKHAIGILRLGLGLARDILGRSAPLFPPVFTNVSRGDESTFAFVKRRLGLIESDQASTRWIERLDPNASALLFWAQSRERLIDRLGTFARVIFVPSDADRSMGPLGWITRPVRLGSKLSAGMLAAGVRNAVATVSRGRRR